MVRKKTQQKKEQGAFLVLVLLSVFLASFFVLFARDPERVVAKSLDHVVRIEGVSHAATSVQVLRLTSVEESIPQMKAPVYEVSVQSGGALHEAVIQYHIPEHLRSQAVSTLALIVFDPESLTWKPIDTIIDETAWVARAEISVQHVRMIGLGTKY